MVIYAYIMLVLVLLGLFAEPHEPEDVLALLWLPLIGRIVGWW